MTPISLYGGQSESFFVISMSLPLRICISISNACSSLNLLLSFYLHIIGRKENFVLFSCLHGSRSPVDSSPSTKDESLVSLIYFIHLFIIPLLYRVWLSHKRAMFPTQKLPILPISGAFPHALRNSCHSRLFKDGIQQVMWVGKI